MWGLNALWQEEGRIRDTARSVPPSTGVLSCFFDLSYHHYALGDTLTTLIYIACEMHDRKLDAFDLNLLVHPHRPAAPPQGFVTPENYTSHLTNLLPAFTCLPTLRALHILRNGGKSAAYQFIASRYAGEPVWPEYEDHIRQKIAYPLDHHSINAFFDRNGFVPMFSDPRGYGEWAKRFITKHVGQRKLVCINPRQSRLTSVAAVPHRDADLDEWHRFIEEAGRSRPDVVFVQVGGFSEWRHRLLSLENVLIPRALGLTLAHELALMSHADMFMGTSSGFATWATFSRMPYLICNIEHFFAEFAGVRVGATNFPFAQPNQHLLWKQEDADLLLKHLNDGVAVIDAKPSRFDAAAH